MRYPNFIVVSLFVASSLPPHASANEVASPLFENFYTVVGLGDYAANETTNRLEDVDSDWGVYAALMFPKSKYLTYGAYMHGTSADYDTPPHIVSSGFVAIDSRCSVSTVGFGGLMELRHSMGNIEMYAGGGLGLYMSKLTITGSTFGFPGSTSNDSSDIGTHLQAGIQFGSEQGKRLRLEYRKVDLRSSFGDLTQGTVDIGGDFLIVGVSF